MKFGCGPAIDIGPDMKVWSCFPLSNFHKKSIYDFNSMDELMQYYQNLHAKIRIEAGGLYEKCDDCKFRQERLCTGGCLAHTLSQLHDEERVRYEEVYI
jgi:radical SAM protein with 4Fe4S-binding SPASM domain